MLIAWEMVTFVYFMCNNCFIISAKEMLTYILSLNARMYPFNLRFTWFLSTNEAQKVPFWFLSLMTYQSSFCISRQSHPWRRTAEILFKP